MEIQLNPTIYNGGYHIRCHGDNNGSVNCVLIGGEAPFSFIWSTGATPQTLNNLIVGTYTVTVTQNGGNTATASITLREPQVLDPTLYSATYDGGTNISSNGGNDGSIELTTQGGTPPYNFLWSNSSDEQNLYNLAAGTYTVTVTDVNACSVTRSITLTEPTPLTLVSITSPQYNGYNLHCHALSVGQFDGSINITVTGGTPPYQFQWNNGSFDEDPAGLPEGDYSVRITDANDVSISGDITLTQPPAIDVSLSAFEYPNGYNISLFGDYNGSITTTVSGGVTPFAYLWNDGNTNQNRSNIGHGNFALQVTDVNGCLANAELALTQPAREGWALGGNANIDTTSQFIGTTDSVDAVFKTNSLERIRLTGNGVIKFKANLQVGSSNLDSIRMVYVDQNGILKIGPGGNPYYLPPCYSVTPHWKTDHCSPNYDIFNFPSSGNVGIGTTTPASKLSINGGVSVGTNYAAIAATADEIIVEGKIGIGTTTPSATFQLGNGFAINNSYGSNGAPEIGFNFYYNSSTLTRIASNHNPSCIEFNNNGNIILKALQPGNSTWNNLKTIFYNDGRVYIGTSGYIPQPPITPASDDYFILAVDGRIISSEVRVKDKGKWPDYVFENNYKLPPLNQTEEFIKENHHLPGIPSASQIEKEGHDLGEMDALFLKKIEELTLYMIALNNKNEILNKEIIYLKSRLNKTVH